MLVDGLMHLMWGERQRNGCTPSPHLLLFFFADAHPRQQPHDGPRMRKEGDRVEDDLPGFGGSVGGRWLHCSRRDEPPAPTRLQPPFSSEPTTSTGWARLLHPAERSGRDGDRSSCAPLCAAAAAASSSLAMTSQPDCRHFRIGLLASNRPNNRNELWRHFSKRDSHYTCCVWPG